MNATLPIAPVPTPQSAVVRVCRFVLGAILSPIVVAVGSCAIALIFGAVARFRSFERNANVDTVIPKIRAIEAALMSYKTLNMFYPTQSQGLDALVTKPETEPVPKRWMQYVSPGGILDPWGGKLQYRSPGKHKPQSYDLFSFGPDGVESGDDIGNW